MSGDVPSLPSYGIFISQLVRFARCCTSVLDFHSKNLQITSKLLTQGYRYHKLRKTFGKFFRSYSDLLSKFGHISFQEYVSTGISQPVFYGDIVYKLWRVKDTPNFISSGSKIVKRLRRQQYNPLIIERTIGLMLGPSTALHKPFLEHCTLTKKAVGPCPNLLIGNKVLIFAPSDCYAGLLQPSDLNSLQDGRSIVCPIRMSLYIFLLYKIYHLCFTCIDLYDLSA